jgi:hypothetical protein
MTELTLSPNAIEAMRDAGWAYYPPRKWFEYGYYLCDNSAEIADDLSDFTGYDVRCHDSSVDKGYWHVSLKSDDECFDFVKRYNEYYDARERISDTLFNRTLVITKKQYEKIAAMVNHYDRRFVGDHVLIAIPENETTKRIIAILDALSM